MHSYAHDEELSIDSGGWFAGEEIAGVTVHGRQRGELSSSTRRARRQSEGRAGFRARYGMTSVFHFTAKELSTRYEHGRLEGRRPACFAKWSICWQAEVIDAIANRLEVADGVLDRVLLKSHKNVKASSCGTWAITQT